MRTLTTAERTILQSDERDIATRVQVQDAVGAWRTLGALSGTGFTNLDYVIGLDWGRSIDDPTWTGTVTLASSATAASGAEVSISPYMESSPANAGGPLLEGMRRIRWYTTTGSLAGGDGTEHKVFDGYIVEVNHDKDEIQLQVSDLGHLLVITQIEAERPYGPEPGGPDYFLEDAVQAILDDNFGAGVIPLVVDASITGADSVKLTSKFKVERIKVMEAIQNLVQNTVGAVCRYIWNGEEMELRLFLPPRNTEPLDEDDSLFSYPGNRLDVAAGFRVRTEDIRNVGTIRWKDATKKAVCSLTLTVPESVALYKRRYFELTEVGQINSEPQARRLLTNLINDLAQPKAEGSYQTDYNWAADVYDTYTFVANGVQFTSDQLHAVTKVSHSLAAGRADTNLETRGNVAGYSRQWIRVEGPGEEPSDRDDINVTVNAYAEGSMYGNELFNGKVDGCIWVVLRWGISVRRVHIWARQTKAGVTPALWPLTSSDNYKAITLDRPEGATPRGNWVRESDGKIVWQHQLPIATNPGDQRTFIIQAEGDNGTKSKQVRLGPITASDPAPGMEAPPLASWSVARVDATTIRYTWTASVSGTHQVIIMRDRIGIDMVTRTTPGPHTYDDKEVHADRSYECAVISWFTPCSGPREIAFIQPWEETIKFGTPPDLVYVDGEPKVRIYAPIDVPESTTIIRLQKSVDSGQTEDWTTITEIEVDDFPYLDAIVMTGQFYRYQAVDDTGETLDTSQPMYWTNPL